MATRREFPVEITAWTEDMAMWRKENKREQVRKGDGRDRERCSLINTPKWQPSEPCTAKGIPDSAEMLRVVDTPGGIRDIPQLVVPGIRPRACGRKNGDDERFSGLESRAIRFTRAPYSHKYREAKSRILILEDRRWGWVGRWYRDQISEVSYSQSHGARA